MEIKALKEKVLLANKRDVLRVHLYFKFVENKIKSSENDLDIIIELYIFGGYNDSKQQSIFMDMCLKKGLKKSLQSLRNTFSKYVNKGVFDKTRNTSLKINEKYLPIIDCDRLILQHIISHAE